MKGQHFLVAILVVFLLIVIYLLVALPFGTQAKETGEAGSTTLRQMIEIYETYEFNEESLFVDTDNPHLESNYDYFTEGREDGTSEYCQKLKECIIESIKNRGEPCLITDIHLSATIYPDSFGLVTCPGLGEINETVGDITRKICTVDSTGDMGLRCPAYGNPFEDYNPFIHGCYIKDDFIYPTETRRTYYMYQPPYYEFGDEFDGTGVTLRLVLTNATIGEDGECYFNMMMCDQPAIAKTNEGLAFEIFQHFRTKITDDMKCCFGTSGNAIYSRPYEFDFTGEDDVPNLHQIVAAIDTGLWEWSKLNLDNTALIDRILAENVPEDWDPDYIRFNYTPLTMNVASSSITYPQCVDWGIGIVYEPGVKNILYSSQWSGNKKDNDYDNLAISYTFNYNIEEIEEDDETKQILVMTPYIGICRDK